MALNRRPTDVPPRSDDAPRGRSPITRRLVGRTQGGRLAVVLTAAVLVTAACGSGSGSSTSSGGTITLGVITSLTGGAAGSYADAAIGAKARIDQQNAEGGVNGHKLVLDTGDDQTNPAQYATQAKVLVEQKHAFGVISFSAFTFAGAKYLQQQGVPVTGSAIDGPEWGQEPYSNMFSYTPPLFTPFDGKYYTYQDGVLKLLKAKGLTKLATMTVSGVPSGQIENEALVAAAKANGISDCYHDNSLGLTQFDYTPQALAIKSAGCDGASATLADAGIIAAATSWKNAGINPIQYYSSGGYDQAVLETPSARTALDGAYFSGTNFVTPNAATQKVLDALKKYDPKYTGGIPTLGLFNGYLSADLMIRGLEAAGKDPSQKSFISGLRAVDDYTADGVLSSPISFQHFGTSDMLPTSSCTDLMQLQGTKYVAVNDGKPVCGTKLAFSSGS